MTKIRLFWSYDVIKTEQWLNTMVEKGFVLRKVSFLLGVFEFEVHDNDDRKYRIVYDKRFRGIKEELPQDLIQNGFKEVCYDKKFYVLFYIDEPDIKPSYANLLERNQKISFTIGIVALIMSLLFLSSLINPYTQYNYLQGINYGYEYGYVINVLLLILLFTDLGFVFFWFKLGETNKQLAKLCGDKVKLNFTASQDLFMSEEELNVHKLKGCLKQKTKLYWRYSPDKVEKWLEEMEKKGYNLYRLSESGIIFYFVKGKPRNIKYVVDNQKSAMPEYFSINQEAGWKLIFRSLSRSYSDLVWSHEITGEELLFMYDNKENLKRSRRLFFMYGISSIFISAIYVSILLSYFVYTHTFSMKLNGLEWILVTGFLIIIFHYIYIMFKSLGYYLRMRKNISL